VQVDPIKPALKAPGIKRLKLKYDGPLSNFAFNFNLCRYIQGIGVDDIFVFFDTFRQATAGAYTRSLLSSS